MGSTWIFWTFLHIHRDYEPGSAWSPAAWFWTAPRTWSDPSMRCKSPAFAESLHNHFIFVSISENCPRSHDEHAIASRGRRPREHLLTRQPSARRFTSVKRTSPTTTCIDSVKARWCNHNFASLTPAMSSLLKIQSRTPLASMPTSSLVFPACKHTLTLSSPFGTVGYVIGLTRKPSLTRCAASARGSEVRSGMMGVVEGWRILFFVRVGGRRGERCWGRVERREWKRFEREWR